MDLPTMTTKYGEQIPIPGKTIRYLQKQWLLMGWGSSIPESQEAKILYFSDIARALSYNNPYCLREVPYGITIKLFFEDLTMGFLDKKPFPNVSDIMYAFKKWQAQNRVKVRKAHLAKNGGTYENITELFAKYIPKDKAKLK